jgi:hypothetical protein
MLFARMVSIRPIPVCPVKLPVKEIVAPVLMRVLTSMGQYAKMAVVHPPRLVIMQV